MIYHKTLNDIGSAILIAGILLVPMKFMAAYVPLLPLESICIGLGAMLIGMSRWKWEQKKRLPENWMTKITGLT